ncbi:hypothetical protein MMC30_000485 [Trapelia coarctata]|nr:hypothetical protein [Trapelia coarctata]
MYYGAGLLRGDGWRRNPAKGWKPSEFGRIDALYEFTRSIELGVLQLSQLSSKDIKARSKSNYFVKALVCVQAAWLIAQVIGRAMNRLAITTLEVTAAGYALCAFVTYIFWWSKPQDPEVPVILDCRDYTIDEFRQLLYPDAGEPPVKKEQLGSSSTTVDRPILYQPLSTSETENGPRKDGRYDIEAYCLEEVPPSSGGLPQTLRIEGPEQATVDDIEVEDWVFRLCVLVMSVFGAVHCAAWNFHFPSAVESVLWKVSSLLASIIPVGMGFGSYLDSIGYVVKGVVMNPALVIYLLVRLYLLVEVFIGLRSMPISAYQTVSWATWIPHV